jgi:glucan phosphoethanolaminetransferase (alkaline phosphatase superfamily)
VFETVLGIPAHPLLIHAAVVFVPLLVVGAIVYPLVPRVRDRIRWALLALAVIAPLSALAAMLSGQAFKARLHRNGRITPEFIPKIDQHQAYGTRTFYWTLGLGLATLVLIGYAWRAKDRPLPKWYWTVGSALTIVVGAVVGYYVFKTGDTGAHIVWSGM